MSAGAPALIRARRVERVVEAVVLLVPFVLVLAFGRFGEDAAAATRARPIDADEVLLTVLADPERQATFAREALLRQRPGDVGLALEVARRHIEDARRNSDPRALGWAEAALAPYVDDARAPVEVKVLRATIRQSRHDFDGAVADLDAALARDPAHAQAALTRATIACVVGRPAAARPDCEVVRKSRAHPIVSAVCHAVIDGLTGQAEQGRRRIDAVLGFPPEQLAPPPPPLRAWALSTRGELLRALGDRPSAEADLRAALALAPGDAWATAALADLLLDTGRPAEVLTLVGDSNVDNLVLRRALATLALGRDAAADLGTLRARHAAARARGDAQHLREEARLVLGADHDAARALELARDNWLHQKEVPDARVLLEAALAAGRPEAAAPVVEHARATGLVDADLTPLIARLPRPDAP